MICVQHTSCTAACKAPQPSASKLLAHGRAARRIGTVLQLAPQPALSDLGGGGQGDGGGGLGLHEHCRRKQTVVLGNSQAACRGGHGDAAYLGGGVCGEGGGLGLQAQLKE